MELVGQKKAIVEFLLDRDGQPPSVIALALKIDKRTTSAVLSKLVSDGLVKRKYRRVKSVHATFGKNMSRLTPFYFLKKEP